MRFRHQHAAWHHSLWSSAGGAPRKAAKAACSDKGLHPALRTSISTHSHKRRIYPPTAKRATSLASGRENTRLRYTSKRASKHHIDMNSYHRALAATADNIVRWVAVVAALLDVLSIFSWLIWRLVDVPEEATDPGDEVRVTCMSSIEWSRSRKVTKTETCYFCRQAELQGGCCARGQAVHNTIHPAAVLEPVVVKEE